ncbi:MAG: TIM barrel protein [Vicinamibacterales bacterium]
MNPIGIMQGRLVPPVDGRIQAFPAENWRDEFARAETAGLATIEWIYESHGRDVNPLCSDGGIAELRALSARHAVAVRSVCADYFMEQPLVRAGGELPARLAHLQWLIDRCHTAGVGRVVLPFVDASDVRTPDEEGELVANLARVEPAATAAGIELHLEMSFGPERFAAFLDRLPAAIRVNYDSGNSAALGYHPGDEFAAYGGRIGSVHVKDRRRGGGTVPLGTGDADLPSFFAELRRIAYAGDVILQVARGEAGQEVESARRNRAFVEAALR